MLLDYAINSFWSGCYNPREYYYKLMQDGSDWAHKIAAAMDYSDNTGVRAVMLEYAKEMNLHPVIMDIIVQVDWI